MSRFFYKNKSAVHTALYILFATVGYFWEIGFVKSIFFVFVNTDAALTQQLFLRFFPDTPFPVLPSVVVCHSYFLQSELIERAEKSPLIFPKEKTRGLNALNFNFLLSFLVLLGFWLCVCLQRSGLCPTSPRLHARKVRQKRLPVSAPVHYPTAKAGRLSACPP